MTRSFTLTALVLALIAAGCGSGGGGETTTQAAGKACAPAPPAMTETPALPAGFPTVAGTTYTKNEKVGPSDVVTGYWNGDIDGALKAFHDAITHTKGYSVTTADHNGFDAEVNFVSLDHRGQVKLVQACEGRTSVAVSSHPQ